MLLDALQVYCDTNDIPYWYFNYEAASLDLNAIKALLVGRSVLLVDNADLYLNQDILNEMLREADFIIVALHHYDIIDAGDACFLNVVYDGQNLTVKNGNLGRG